MPVARRVGKYCLQYQPAIAGQKSVGRLEECRVPRFSERLPAEGALILVKVRPTTLTSYFSIARFIAEPQPQPISSSVIPGCRPSLPRARSILAICAC